MEKMFEKIKENPIKSALLTVLGMTVLIIVVPILINASFEAKNLPWFMQVKWEAEDVLGYYGSVLEFLGTAVLSFLALWQNQKIKEESDKRQNLLENMEYEKNLPLLKCYNLLCNGKYANLKVKIHNFSDNVATELSVSDLKIEDVDGNNVCQSTNIEIAKTELEGNDETVVSFTNGAVVGKNLKIVFELRYRDKFKKLHKCSVSYMINDAEKFSTKDAYRIAEI